MIGEANSARRGRARPCRKFGSLAAAAAALTIGACSEDARPGTPVDADAGGQETSPPARDSADVPVSTGEVADSAAGETLADSGPSAVCTESPGAIFAHWPLPDPSTRGTPHAQSYDLGVPGVVVDQVTHLWWQRNVDVTTRTWRDAKQYCACLSLGGHDDWRLPSRIELVSIVDFTQHGPSIDSVAFPATPLEWFWTSTALAADPSEAWYIYFDNGFSKFIVAEDFPYRARCVRSDPVPPVSPRYTLDAETVLDNETGLRWQRSFAAMGQPWEAAKVYCAQLTTAGGHWRLPNMRELQSLVDETRSDPAIDPEVFPDTPGVEFWTGSPVAGAPGSAWRVSFANGYTYDATVNLEYLARCVK
jgi:hypothetical protein